MLAIIILINLNGAVYMGFGTARMFTPIIAICCLILIQACLHSVSIKKALGIPGFLIVAALVSYLFISCFMAFVNASWEKGYSAGIVIGHLFSLVTIIATAIGGRAVIRQAGPEPVLKAILVLLTLDCILILATPILMLMDFYIHDNIPVDFYIYDNVPGVILFFGLFLDPNGAGLIGCATIVLALSFFSRKQHRKFAYLALTVGVLVTIGTGSRIAVISFLFFIFYFVIFNFGVLRFVLKGTVFIILSGIISGIISYLTLPHFYGVKRLNRFILTLLGKSKDVSIKQRVVILPLALEQIFESPIFGLGVGKMYSVENAPMNDIVPDRPFGVHNNFLFFWGEGGIIPVTLCLLFFITFLLFSLKISNPVVKNAVFGWVLIIAIFCLAHHIIIEKRTVAFLIGLSCALVGFGNYVGTKQDSES